MDSYNSLWSLLMDNLIIVAEHILLILFADMFLHRRWRNRVSLLPAIILCWGIQFLIHRQGIGQVKILFSLALDAAFLLIYYSGNRHISGLLKKLFLLICFYVFMAVAQAVSIIVLFTVCGENFQTATLHTDPVLTWGAYVTSLLLVMLCLLFCERFRRVETVPLSIRNWLLLLAMPITSIVFVWLSFPFGRKNVDEYTLLLMIGFSMVVLCFNLYAFHLYRNIAKNSAVLCRYQDLQRYCKHLDALLQSEGKRRDTIHDYLHNLGVITALIEDGRSCDAAEYIYELEQQIKKIHIVKHTGNREVDAILSSKLPQMDAQGVSCKIDGILPPAMPFEFLDVCALLSNALDNALESCIRQELDGAAISLRVSYRNGFFKVRLSNPFVSESPHPTWELPNQGRGLLIMQDVVERYEGAMSIGIQDGRFVFSAFLQKPISNK